MGSYKKIGLSHDLGLIDTYFMKSQMLETIKAYASALNLFSRSLNFHAQLS